MSGGEHVDRYPATEAQLRAEIERLTAERDALLVENCGLRADTERVDFLQRWVDDSERRGFVWDTFTFNCTGPTVRYQLDEQIAAGLRELPKHDAARGQP